MWLTRSVTSMQAVYTRHHEIKKPECKFWTSAQFSDGVPIQELSFRTFVTQNAFDYLRKGWPTDRYFLGWPYPSPSLIYAIADFEPQTTAAEHCEAGLR